MSLKIAKYAAGIAVAALATGSIAQAADLRIGAMRTGSAWYVFAATLEKLLEPQMNSDNTTV